MKFDVLIVGAGVTGALLFLALKKKNMNVGLIDGRDKAPNSYRHLSLNNKSMIFLKEMDAWSNISKTAFEYNQIKVWDQEGTGFIDFNVNELEKKYSKYWLHSQRRRNSKFSVISRFRFKRSFVEL